MKISAFECETKTFLKNLKATYYRKVNSPGKDTGKETVTQYWKLLTPEELKIITIKNAEDKVNE
jgi:hypothetical protein